MLTGIARNQTTNLQISGQPTQPAEPQPPETIKKKKQYLDFNLGKFVKLLWDCVVVAQTPNVKCYQINFIKKIS